MTGIQHARHVLRLSASVLMVFLLTCHTAKAEELSIKLGFPVDCTLGEDCWTVNYLDVDPSKNAQDFTCSYKTYDTHKGTDFAVRNYKDMLAGVPVKAAASGTVLRTRDGESDLPKTEKEYKALLDSDIGCGNGVIIKHIDNIETQYCHLKEGSLRVKSGDIIEKGQVIGLVGQSGAASFPHLHFGITKDGQHIDPYTGHFISEGCDVSTLTNLWEDQLGYEPYTVFDAGFRTAIPDWEKIKMGTDPNPEVLPLDSPNFVYWIGYYHAHAGDQIEMTIYDPNGEVLAESATTLKQGKKVYYQYVGSSLKTKKLVPGMYFGVTHLKRKGYPKRALTHQVKVKHSINDD